MKKKSAKNKVGKKIVFVLDIEPYSQQCIVVCNGSFKDAYEIFKKHDNPRAKSVVAHIEKDKDEFLKEENLKESGGAYLYHDLPYGFVLTLNHQDSWIETVGLIVHEVTHLTHYVFRKVRLPLTEDSEEAYTYLTEDLVEKILSKIY